MMTLFFAGALAALAQLVTIEPLGLPLSRTNRIELSGYIEKEKWLEAEAALFRHVQDVTDSAALHKALAVAHFRNGRYLLAASAYGRAARIEPLDPGSRFTLAVAYVAMDRRHWARREFEALAEEFPRNPLYPYWIAGIYQQYQWFQEAIRESRRAIALQPAYFMAYDRLGQCLEALGKTDEALAAYNKADELARAAKDSSPWPIYHHGSLLRQNGRFLDALAALERAAELDPKHAETQHELALTLDALDRGPAAVAAMESATQLQPENPKFHYALSRLRRRMGDAKGAVAALEQFKRLSNGHP